MLLATSHVAIYTKQMRVHTALEGVVSNGTRRYCPPRHRLPFKLNKRGSILRRRAWCEMGLVDIACHVRESHFTRYTRV
jgi:hypothetical protein